MTRPDRVVGSLVGLAVGDCLGAPVEGRSREQIRALHGTLGDFLHASPVWTDDTQQALVLVESTVRSGRPDPEWVATRWVEMARARVSRGFGLHRGTGSGFRDSVLRFAESRDWSASGSADRAGNGAAMRVAPVAVALRGLGDDDLAEVLLRVSLVTHRESRAIAGAQAVGWVASRLADEPCFPLQQGRGRALLAELARWLRERESRDAERHPSVRPGGGGLHDVSDLLGRLEERWDSGLPELEATIVFAATERRGKRTAAGHGFVLASVVFSIALVLASREPFEATVVRAVNLGGDADTVGAMVGGMAGAAAGPGAIPARWLRFDGHEELVAWGRALEAATAGAPRPDVASLPDLLALERRLGRALGYL